MEGQELLVSLLIEPYGSMVDALAEGLEADGEERLDPAMTTAEMRGPIGRHYGWALAYDFSCPETSRYFWYYSEEKIEPRRGERRSEPGADREMPIAVARDVGRLAAVLDTATGDETLGSFLAHYAELCHVARRAQIGARHPYAEIRDNLISADCRPIDLLRAKLTCFCIRCSTCRAASTPRCWWHGQPRTRRVLSGRGRPARRRTSAPRFQRHGRTTGACTSKSFAGTASQI